MIDITLTGQFWDWIAHQIADMPDDLSPDETAARLRQRWTSYVERLRATAR